MHLRGAEQVLRDLAQRLEPTERARQEQKCDRLTHATAAYGAESGMRTEPTPARHQGGCLPAEFRLMSPVGEVAEFWESEAARYDHAYDTPGRTGRVLRSRQEMVLQLLGDGPGEVLDAGMGPGRLLLALSERGWRVSGVDVSEAMVALAASRVPDAPERLVRASVERLPFPDSSFDAVVATGVLEYVAYSERAIDELARVLRPGGLAVISIPNPSPVQRLWRRGLVYPLARAVKRIAPFGRRAPLWRPPPPRRGRFEEALADAGFAPDSGKPIPPAGQLVYRARKRRAPSATSGEPEVPAGYHQTIYEVEQDHWWHRGMRAISGALLEDRLRRGGRMLDVGCGSGGFLRWAREQGSFEQLAGADISAEAIELARERVPEAELHVAPIWELPFERGSFDLVVLNDVLQHVPAGEVAPALREVRRMLRDDGELLVRTNGARRAREEGDWRVYDRATLRSTLEQAGLRCRRLTYANLIPSLWAAVRRGAPRAPSSERHGIPSIGSAHLNRLMYFVLRMEAGYFRRLPLGLPYGHTLFALVTVANERSGGIREAREQMPGRLARIDDSRGIGWRLSNAARRASPRFAARFASTYLRGANYERPVFIIGPPRSGTTMVFELLKSSSALDGLPWEGHDVWRAFHHPRWSGWDSDAVGSGGVRFGERRFVNAYFHSHLGPCRLVEKTPENALRVPYLLDLFPDATFIAVRRNPCEVISSIINGWRDPAGRFRSYYVPESLRIPGHDDGHMWCFALIEGWREYATRPVPEIAFAQWDQLTAAAEDARSLVAPQRWLDVRFEDLLERPETTASSICATLDIEVEPGMLTRLDELRSRPENALSPAEPAKWRRDNGRELSALLPQIAEHAADRGYQVDPVTGDCEPG
jgi:ubiquinone/menaquinone biosynthesis C-methylase UbiE